VPLNGANDGDVADNDTNDGDDATDIDDNAGDALNGARPKNAGGGGGGTALLRNK
jgi:hypothetical protein